MFKNKYSGRLAVLCSDERFIKSTLTYLSKSLDIKHCDLMIVPGGPAFIINNEKSLLDRLKLLVNAHKINSVFVFSHSDCGYYKNCYKDLSSELLINKQVEDIKKCQLKLNKMFPKIIVKSFYVNISKKRFIFKCIKQRKAITISSRTDIVPFYTYILKCSDKSLYTGITTNIERRVKEHNKGKGCKYTYVKRPVKCIYSEEYPTRSLAMKRESQIKSWTRKEKLSLVVANSKK